MIFPPNSDYTIVLQKDSYYLAISMLLAPNIYAFTTQFLCFCNALNISLLQRHVHNAES